MGSPRCPAGTATSPPSSPSACPWPGPPTARPSSPDTRTTRSASGPSPSPPTAKNRRDVLDGTHERTAKVFFRLNTSLFYLRIQQFTFSYPECKSYEQFEHYFPSVMQNI